MISDRKIWKCYGNVTVNGNKKTIYNRTETNIITQMQLYTHLWHKAYDAHSWPTYWSPNVHVFCKERQPLRHCNAHEIVVAVFSYLHHNAGSVASSYLNTYKTTPSSCFYIVVCQRYCEYSIFGDWFWPSWIFPATVDDKNRKFFQSFWGD